MKVQGQVKNMEEILHMASEVWKLMNKMLESLEKEGGLKKLIDESYGYEETSRLENTIVPSIEKLKFGGNTSKQL